MTYFNSYIFHIRNRTALGRAMIKDPIQSFFFILRGNFIDSNDWISNLYRKYAQWKFKR